MYQFKYLFLLICRKGMMRILQGAGVESGIGPADISSLLEQSDNKILGLFIIIEIHFFFTLS